jgi:hypothetical protein
MEIAYYIKWNTGKLEQNLVIINYQVLYRLKEYTTLQKKTNGTDLFLGSGIIVLSSFDFENVIVYKIETYFTQLEIERGSRLV